MMLDYFRAIGFPCPELENPLMYYRKMMPQYLGFIYSLTIALQSKVLDVSYVLSREQNLTKSYVLKEYGLNGNDPE